MCAYFQIASYSIGISEEFVKKETNFLETKRLKKMSIFGNIFDNVSD